MGRQIENGHANGRNCGRNHGVHLWNRDDLPIWRRPGRSDANSGEVHGGIWGHVQRVHGHWQPYPHRFTSDGLFSMGTITLSSPRSPPARPPPASAMSPSESRCPTSATKESYGFMYNQQLGDWKS
ncbi:uncharacterized protein HMPREF1120_05639 [Exophiala dermatitidis NIH/UT8656]|uniref:Uncharacterized protein n=1 Tax=Exophiala dermatitidis (strain ATCC 34100 / CBS 525.76 / NIH/UT8656) TaxID=858893 RepID=H6C4D7_EXODN|nr:uncharacterized protein HMPREF1120_05639 [Exophiala dermatitidis NIH/UT8656]EHY57610.1 hypothetical protein HMPREF1120_05639 [Exophiala dermatitidis NIH/UT8656]